MDRQGHDNVSFFVGSEVEHTPAFGKRTLFVVGLHHPDTVIEILKEFETFNDPSRRIEHVYFGANMSFPNPDINDTVTWSAWEDMIRSILNRGYLCTLDIDVKCAEGLAESGLTEYNNFIPMISVKLPYIQLLGYNATIKLDDKDFASTNPGVWCHSLHELKNRRVFTDWSKYTKDEVIK
jgi:hypothetical protein